MNYKVRKSMDPLFEWNVPMLYPDTPTFLGVPLAQEPADLEGVDVAIIGVPFEGTPGVARSYSNSLLTPINLRKDSVKYGGYLPELDLDIFEHLKVVDYGDAPICVRGDVKSSIASVQSKVADVLAAGALPVVLGGTEICAAYGLVSALAEHSKIAVGALTLDAHGDNLEEHLGERWCSATWIARMAELPKVRMDRHVHLGMRGPRNFKEQVVWFREKGTTLYTAREIKDKGITQICHEITERIHRDTDKVFMNIDFDVLDLGCAPGLDEPLGLTVGELLQLTYQVGKSGIDGFDVGWIPNAVAPLHWITVYAILYLLAGLIEGLKKEPRGI
ncbi:MAG: arginase family protein [Bacillota bacterium]|jgi:guanidinopropionase